MVGRKVGRPCAICTIVIPLLVGSPWPSNPNAPMIPAGDDAANTFFRTEVRLPSERAIAPSRISAAAAPYGAPYWAYSSGPVDPRIVLPSRPVSRDGTPAIVKTRP